MDQYPAKLSQPHQPAVPPPPDCGTHPTVHEPLPYPPTSFDPKSFTCITSPYGAHTAPNFAECCDSPVANFTTVHLTSEGPSSCAAYCSVEPHRLLVSDYRSSDFHTCVFGGPEEDKDVQLECWDGEGFVGDLDWEDRFTKKDGSKRKKRSPQEEVESSAATTTTYDPSFWSSLISAAETETATPILLTGSSTTATATYDSSLWSSLISAAATDTASVGLPVLSTTTTTTAAANGTAASSGDATLATGSFVSVSEVSGTRSSTGGGAGATSTGPAGTSASATTDAAASSGGSTASSSASASASAAESSSATGAASSAQLKGAYGKWLCTGLLLSVVFASLQ
ncbi:uncharacterized protein BKCO1_100024 [Diplodia corticola]|uniref:Uncharacterized protein n=1 Tax=Diplodia corticola TaxID=236234 RepID=A0A1J9SJY9_9PEZI|nr:uncharacterized protein BKCO1_100024 [Diplodia corticola]OJD40663.1 hypothetical protein BKCO1_100024 [Diplodia corticola]